MAKEIDCVIDTEIINQANETINKTNEIVNCFVVLNEIINISKKKVSIAKTLS